ncbi:MAG: hypothetical protein M0Z69_13090, partial [Actinomycetota bacterium]|nr:hypothetical protein [Actinomycetota bacterium]
ALSEHATSVSPTIAGTPPAPGSRTSDLVHFRPDLRGKVRRTSDPAALWQLLRLLAQVATYDPERRSTVFELWPGLMATAFEEINRGRDPRRTRTSKSNYRRPGSLIPKVRLFSTGARG